MFCSKCGNEISDSDYFCPNCGEKIIKNHNNYIDDEVYRNIKLLNNKHHNRRKKKNNKKIVIGSSIASGLIIIVILCLTVGRRILVNYYYNKGYTEYKKWIEMTDNGLNVGEEGDEDYELFWQIGVDFNYCEMLLGNNKDKYDINYELVSNFNNVVKLYYKRGYLRGDSYYNDVIINSKPIYFSLSEWYSKIEYVDSFEKTGEPDFDYLIDVLHSGCEAAILYYNYDFQGAYDEIVWCKEYYDEALEEIYCVSLGLEKLVNDERYNIESGNIDIQSYYIFTTDASDELKYYENYPIIICNYNSGYSDYYWCYKNGVYSKYILDAYTAYNVSYRDFGDGGIIKYQQEELNDLYSHVIDGSISFVTK